MKHSHYWERDIDYKILEFSPEYFRGYEKKVLPFISQLYASQETELLDKKSEIISVIDDWNPFFDDMTEEESLNWYNRVCWVTCLSMIIEFLSKENVLLKYLLQYRDNLNEYTDGQWNKKSHTYYAEWLWRYHWWLVRIWEKYWLKWNAYKVDIEEASDSDELIQYIDLSLREKKVLILSVKLWFDSDDEWKWWHLIIPKEINFDSREVLVHDPYMPHPIVISFDRLYWSFSWRLIEFEKNFNE